MTIIDESVLRKFESEGVEYQTAYAFAHLFAVIDEKTTMQSPFKERFQECGIITPEDTLLMQDITDNLEWILLTELYQGKLERRYNEEKKEYQYKATEQGRQDAIRIIQDLLKKTYEEKPNPDSHDNGSVSK